MGLKLNILQDIEEDILKVHNSCNNLKMLELGDQIAKRRERIQADRERVVANQRRTADQIIKLK